MWQSSRRPQPAGIANAASGVQARVDGVGPGSYVVILWDEPRRRRESVGNNPAAPDHAERNPGASGRKPDATPCMLARPQLNGLVPESRAPMNLAMTQSQPGIY